MPEELRDDSLSYMAKQDASTLAAWQESTDLMDKVMEDVNGQRLGRVLKCFAEEGRLVKCEIKVDNNAKGIFGVEQDVAAVPSDWIGSVDERIHLKRAGEQVFRPADPAPLGEEPDKRGSSSLPRKIR